MNDADRSPSPLEPLLSPEGWQLLNSLPPYSEADSLTLNQRLRKQGHSPELVAAALTQSSLRAEAVAKFGEFAEKMLFTRDGLQQATRLPVAARHAQRFREAGLTHAADLGCGLGGDTMALASLGLNVIAVEADETTAAAATVNLMAFPEAEVLHTTAEEFMDQHGPLPEGWGLWLDPARRDAGRGHTGSGSASRVWDPEAFSPPLSFVTSLAETGIPMGVKMGPGIPHELIPQGCEAEWVSDGGDVVEVVLWFNSLARQVSRDEADAEPSATSRTVISRAATVLHSGEEGRRAVELTSASGWNTAAGTTAAPDAGADTEADGVTSTARLPTPDEILYEPDGAVIRAGLVQDCAAAFGGELLDEHIAYFVTAEPYAGDLAPLARGYRVEHVMDVNVKILQRWAQEESVTSLEIKKRGVDIVPEQLRQQVLSGTKSAKKTASGKKTSGKRAKASKVHRTLVLVRIGEERIAAVVQPL